MLKEIILAVIVSFDTFLVSAACFGGGIRIPLLPAALIDLIGAAVLGLSLGLSELIGRVVSEELCRSAGTAVLCLIGTVTVFKSLLRSLMRRLSERGELSLKTGNSGLMIKLYLDDTAADVDHSSSLSVSEAAALALASSLDSAATGLSSGMVGISPVKAAVFAFISGAAAIFGGVLAGKKISSLGHDLSWLGGVFLILFAVFGQSS
ncbi:MAG: manganese efflux pump [Ruminococcus sp.]|nr:manganese efflux pump [Ruminococcus sp.]